MQLLNPIVLRLQQTQVILAYPFKYLSAVNGKASEVVAHYQNRQNFTGCDDTSFVKSTCGIKHDKGVAIPYSEGFCCFCPEKAVSVKQTRGGQDCSLPANPMNFEEQKRKASAHCLHFSDIWYTVNALNDPMIFHDVSVEVFNELYLSNGSVWISLTNNEEFKLGNTNPSQFDLNNTIMMTYYTESRKNSSQAISVEDNRLLIPQPMPGLDIDKLPDPVKNGARDYLLLSKSVIAPSGDMCDTAGVSYEGFAKQANRCSIVKNSCLKNQPLDLWLVDDEKRKVQTKGKYLLGNYGTPHKEPIMIDKETKEHWLAFEYYDKQRTVVTIEFNADKIVALTPGKHAQILHVVTASLEKRIQFFVTISNKDLAPATFAVQVNDCGFQVPDSNNVSSVVPPQRRKLFEIETKPGAVELSAKFYCSVVVKSAKYGIVARRFVLIKPLDRCICNMHCLCACIGESLKCNPMTQDDYHAAGFRGSLPVLTAKPPRKLWIVHHPLLAIFAFLLFLLLLGFTKGILGFMGFDAIKNLGLKSRIFGKRRIQSYLEPELKDARVVYDDEGYPINPDTMERARVLPDEIIFSLNVLFFCLWPCLRVVDFLPTDEPPEPPPVDYPGGEAYEMDDDYDSEFDSEFDDFDDEEADSFQSVELGQAPAEPIYENVEPKLASEPIYENIPMTSAPTTGNEAMGLGLRPSQSDSTLLAAPSGEYGTEELPNPELALWQKGTARIHQFRG